MRLSARAVVLLCFPLLFSVTTAQAATITTSELPGSIQSCITSAACVVSNTSSYDSGTASAFQISQNTGSGYENDWLLRYTLVPPSGQSRIDWPQPESFSGYLWMLAKSAYSTTETAHPFTVYLDKVSPTPFSMSGQSSGDLNLFMPTADLVAGSSYITWGLDADNNSYVYGNLSGDVPLPCLAANCNGHAQLNLAQLTYLDFGSAGIHLVAFNPSDTRGLVFDRSEYYSGVLDGYPVNDAQSFYVSAVPLPGAAWLFGSGLMGLIGFMRRVRHHQKIEESRYRAASSRALRPLHPIDDDQLRRGAHPFAAAPSFRNSRARSTSW